MNRVKRPGVTAEENEAMRFGLSQVNQSAIPLVTRYQDSGMSSGVGQDDGVRRLGEPHFRSGDYVVPFLTQELDGPAVEVLVTKECHAVFAATRWTSSSCIRSMA